jgi:hypothetical protein
MAKAVKFQVQEEDFVFGNGVWIDPVLYDTREEADRHCHSYRGTVHMIEVEVEHD